ncbi:MAG: RlpA-like protein precursor [Alphaproteobacteria bacterium ADurb.Bin438]|nr:MAG: RlpA-like protein precursor [Alphaproteobacteria bacterium ADurb.Bin438]
MKKLISLFTFVFLISGCNNIHEPYIYSSNSGIRKITNSNGGTYKIGKPYDIFGITYYPEENYDYSERGTASWYGEDFHEGLTANGEKYDMNSMTAAHRTLPLPSIVKVTNLRNNRSVILRVNDRGPFAKNRIIDVSKKAADTLGFKGQGTTEVLVEIIPEESKRLKEELLSSSKSYKNPYLYKKAEVEEYNLVNIKPEPATFDKGDAYDVTKSTIQYIQLGAFESHENALRLKDELVSNNSFLSNEQIDVYTALINSKNFYRVRVGPFYNTLDALKVYNQFINANIKNAKIITDK